MRTRELARTLAARSCVVKRCAIDDYDGNANDECPCVCLRPFACADAPACSGSPAMPFVVLKIVCGSCTSAHSEFIVVFVVSGVVVSGVIA